MSLPHALAISGGVVFSPDYASDGIVFIYGDGIYRSSDYGQNFSSLGSGDKLKSRTVTALYLPPDFATSHEFAAATNGSGVWRSTDSGLSFAPAVRAASIDARVNNIVRVPGGASVVSLQDPGGEASIAVRKSKHKGCTILILISALIDLARDTRTGIASEIEQTDRRQR